MRPNWLSDQRNTKARSFTMSPVTMNRPTRAQSVSPTVITSIVGRRKEPLCKATVRCGSVFASLAIMRPKLDETLESPEFRAKVATGDGPSIELAIQYLENDSKHFRSGYIKADLTDSLKRSTLTSQDCSRLLDVIWNAAAKPGRREFRHYCNLAALIATPDFVERVAQKAEFDDTPKSSFAYLLRYIAN